MKQTENKTPLILEVDETQRTIVMPLPKNPSDGSHDRCHRDAGRIQWLSLGYGGVIDGEKISFKFEQEEFNCVLKYLTKFEWKVAGAPVQEPVQNG